MSTTLHSIDINTVTGEAFVGFDNIVLRIDNLNSHVIDQVTLPASGDIQTVLVEQSYNGILPFYFQIMSGVNSNAKLDFTFNGTKIATAIINVAELDCLSQKVLIESESEDSEVIIPETTPTLTLKKSDNVVVKFSLEKQN